MKIAVTGATGFVGRSVVNELLRRRHDVRVLARDPGVVRSRFNKPVVAVACNLFDAGGLERALLGCEAVVHLVGIILESKGQTFEAVHRTGTQNVVAAAQKAGVSRLLHMSAMGSSADAPSEYGRTKAAGEEAVRGSRLDWTIFRPSIIFGPGDGFVSQLARIIRLNPLFIPVIGPGAVKFMPVSVREVARIYGDALERPETARSTFEIGGPEVLTLNEIYREIAAALGKPKKPLIHFPIGFGKMLASLFSVLPNPPLTRDQLRSLSRDNTADISATIAVFGAPATTLREGIRGYVRPKSRRDPLVGI